MRTPGCPGCRRPLVPDSSGRSLAHAPVLIHAAPTPSSGHSAVVPAPGTRPAVGDQAVAQWLCWGLSVRQEGGVNCMCSGCKSDLQEAQGPGQQLSFPVWASGVPVPGLPRFTAAATQTGLRGTSLGPSVPLGSDQQQQAA